jgi:hypothetical protein
VQPLSSKLLLACRELNVDKLHVQRRLVGGSCRDMHGVRRRQVQECIGSCQLQQLPGRLELTWAEHSFEQLHLQRGLVGA